MNPPNVKQPDLISLTFVAIVEGLPNRITLKEHSLEFVESELLKGSLVTGVYGAHSKQVALVMAADWNKQNEAKRSHRTRALLVDARYRIDNFMESTRQLTTRESLEKTGWLHLDRLSAELREELKAEWLDWIATDFSEKHHAQMAELSFAELAMKHPRYIAKMMAKRSPRLTAIVHPVNPSMKPDEKVWAATVRYEKDRFVAPVVRFMPVVVDL